MSLLAFLSGFSLVATVLLWLWIKTSAQRQVPGPKYRLWLLLAALISNLILLGVWLHYINQPNLPS
ncbi:hypothetical protein [Micromonospora sp. NPDC005652]|uniref:hypothetical protein n=1 Tax=Micromonospora sp. NPDC005652 TaxID=3157046 RepID=UPI003401541D